MGKWANRGAGHGAGALGREGYANVVDILGPPELKGGNPGAATAATGPGPAGGPPLLSLQSRGEAPAPCSGGEGAPRARGARTAPTHEALMENTKDLVRAERSSRFVCQVGGTPAAARPPERGNSGTPLAGLLLHPTPPPSPELPSPYWPLNVQGFPSPPQPLT